MLCKASTWLAAAGITVLASTPAFAISGGEEVPDPSAAPWMVTLAVKGDGPLIKRAMCGGTLISPTRVLTAGHCVDRADPTVVEVNIGASVLSGKSGQVAHVRGIAVHPRYRSIPSPVDPDDTSKSALANDAAIIELSKPVKSVRALPVAHHAPAVGDTVTVLGHGLTEPQSKQNPAPLADVLRRAKMKVIDQHSCNTQLAGVVNGTSALCAKSPHATVCPGDSGGPLLSMGPHGPQVVGIVSFAGEVTGKECGEGAYPGAFADAAQLREWINQPRPVLAPMPSGRPKITGDHKKGGTLTCEVPRWLGKSPDSVEYTWYKMTDDVFIPVSKPEGSSRQLKLNPDLAKTSLQCAVAAKSAGGVTELESVDSKPPTRGAASSTDARIGASTPESARASLRHY